MESAAKFVELIDIGRAEIRRQRIEDLLHGDVQGLGLDAVNVDGELRHGRAEWRQDVLQRALAVRSGNDIVGDALQFRQIETAVLQLKLEGEAACIADALNRRRWHDDDARLLKL